MKGLARAFKGSESEGIRARTAQAEGGATVWLGSNSGRVFVRSWGPGSWWGRDPGDSCAPLAAEKDEGSRRSED